MAFTKVNPGTWGTNDELTSSQMNDLDTDHANSLDKTSAGDTLAGIVQLSGIGRLVMTAVDGADADTTYQPGDYRVIQLSSTITDNRTYTLGTTNAQANDIIEVFALSTFSGYTVKIVDGGTSNVIWSMGTRGGSSTNGWAGMSTYASFIYRSGAWRLYRTHKLGINAQVFTSSGTFTTPVGCTQLLCYGYGGGGGGAGGGAGQSASTTVSSRGGGGGGGSVASWQYMSVNAATSYTVTIGAGGAGGNGGTASGTLSVRLGATGVYGGATSISNGGNILIWQGGGGGSGYLTSDASAVNPNEVTLGGGPVSNLPFPAATTSAWLPYYVRPPVPGHGGCGGCSILSSSYDMPSDGLVNNASTSGDGGTGGSDGADSGSYYGGGGGGGGGGGPGGAGANGAGGGAANNAGNGTAGSAASAASANTGAGGGGGGGGGGASGTAGAGGNGSAGGSGKLVILWF